MPTPASVARQCLAEDAAAALDEAVAVAKRRGHAQTTSFHAVSTLLSLPSSSIREACTRARSNACSPRLQLRALELSVGVALDRQSVSKSPPRADEPPVSNSLMAVIKRSQANQRRHPETFHLYQRQQLSSGSENFSSISVVKVELKHFVMSILDDPIVSRVFGDAGFRTNEIKWAILNPLPVSRFFSSSAYSRCPPLFLRSLSDIQSSRGGPNFPFSMDFSFATERGSENSKRVCEVLVKRNRRNPLLIGNCAKDALRCFIDCLKRNETGVLPEQIDGLSVISIESEIISEFISGQLEEKTVVLKFKEVREMMENCLGPGIILNCGDLKAFVDVESVNVVNCIVSELKRLLTNSGGKLWVIGFLAGDDHYRKLLARFPSLETDWDLHLLPITTSSGGQSFKSSLMGSFVPFGGFFPMPSELESLCTSPTQSPSLCNLCNEKYETEVSMISKGAPTGSIADKHLPNLSSWLQIAQRETSKKTETAEAKNDQTVLDADARVLALKRKWSDICRRVHQEDISKTKSQTFSIPSFSNVLIPKDTADMGPFLNGSRITNLSPFMPKGLQNNFLPKQNMPIACTSPPSGVSVTTDLGLGTLNASVKECIRSPNSQEHCCGVRDFHESSRTYENTSSQVIHSSPHSHQLDKHAYMKDLEYPWNVLAKKVFWQIDAIQAINQTLSRCRSGNGRFHSSKWGNVWFSFLGPDKVGKRKIAEALPEIVFGRKDNLLSLDLRLQDGISPSNSIIDVYDLKHHDVKYGRKMIVDYLAEKMSKCSDSVIVLENIDKADIFVQNSLFQAVKTGKFSDSHGRDINIKNTVFVLTSNIQKVSDDLRFGRVASEFTEEKILEAKNLQMQILVNEKNYSQNNKSNVSVTPSNVISNQCRVNKRKRSCQFSRSMIDLNLPVEDTEEDSDTDKGIYDDDNDSLQNSEMWLEELLEHVDENVVFKPFDFDYLNDKILKEIDIRLKKIVGDGIFLEIDREVMLQILAAAWLTGGNDALEDWIENVLCSTIEEAWRRYNINSGTFMQLVPISGLVVEEQASGLCLPTRICMN